MTAFMTIFAPQLKLPKILHVVISMGVGGAERLVYDVVRNPVFAEHPPVVCCMDSLGELGGKLINEGYTVHCKGRKPGLDLSMILWLRDKIREHKADVVHAHQYSPLFYAVPAACLAGRVKVIYTEHGRFYPERKSWKRSVFNPVLALGVDHLVSISVATAQAMATYDNFPMRRIKVIHNGIDCSTMNPPVNQAAKRQELGLPPSGPVIGTAARLNSIKNIQMMLRVLKLVLPHVPHCFLIIAGQGEEEHALKALAADLCIEENVRFIGLRDDLGEIYQLFDVFLLTSFSEGISVTLLESMATGVPSVVTDVGGNHEVVVEGKTGYLTEVNDSVMMAARIMELLEKPELAAQIGAAAKHHVEANFSVQAMLGSYLSLYLR
ncbi:MAG: glycosyltransferase [Geobacter sp.]|nr:glycosyltransferase [Geobacter sp.]